jgi:hypothetical protein
MPARGKTPGLKRGRHRLPYWIASQVTRDLMGFPDKCIPLPAGADDATLERLCQEHTARLQLWIAEQRKPRDDGHPPIRLTPYDGTVLVASRIYQEHPDSDFHAVKHNTRRSYTDSLKIIEASVGKRLIRNVRVTDVKRWYREWANRRLMGVRNARIGRTTRCRCSRRCCASTLRCGGLTASNLPTSLRS